MAVKIRRAEPEDAAAVRDIYACPGVVWGTLQLPYPSLEHHQKRLEAGGSGNYTLLAEVEGAVVGHLNLSTALHSPRRRHVGGIGMGVHDAWQGKGIGTALMAAAVDMADRWLHLTRLELDVYTDNEPAVRLYKKFGFMIEGTRVGYAFRDGQLVDVYLMGRVLAR